MVSEAVSVSGAITDIKSVVIDGNTVFYFMLDGEDAVFSAMHSIYEKLPFLQIGDTIDVDYRSESIGGLYLVEQITRADGE